MRLPFERKITAVFAVAMLLLCGVAALTDFAHRRINANIQGLRQTHQLIDQLQSLLSNSTIALLAQRDFLSTRERQFLGPCRAALARSEQQIREIRRLIEGNEDQRWRLELLVPLIEQCGDLCRKTLESVEAAAEGEEKALLGQGRDLMEKIRGAIGGMDEAERQRLLKREKEAEERIRRGRAFIMAGRIIALGIVSVSFVIARHDLVGRRRAEAALRAAHAELTVSAERIKASEALLSNAARIARLGHWRLDVHTQQVECSEVMLEMCGICRETFAGTFHDALAWVYPDDQGKLLALRECLREGQPIDFEHRYLRRDGTVLWVHARAQAEFDAEGNPLVIYGTAMDITEGKRAGEELRRSETQLRQAQRIARLGSWTVDWRTGQVIWSDVMLEICGITREQFGGTLEFVDAMIPAEERPAREVVEQGGNLDGEHRVIRPDGSTVWLQSRAEREFDAEGRIIMLHGTALDITKRKLAELELRHSEEELENAQRIARLAHWEIDVRTGRRRWSPRMFEFYRITPRELEDDSNAILSRIHPEDLPALLESRDAFIRKGEPLDFQFRVMQPDGEQLWLHVRGEAPRDASGQLLSLRGTLQDISEAKRLEEGLRRSEARERARRAEVRRLNSELEQRVKDRTERLEIANQELESFSYSVSHDLRAPLRVIAGYSQMLAESVQGRLNEAEHDYLAQTRAAADRMSQLIDDLLDLSRITRTEMSFEPLDLSALVETVVRELRRQSPDRNIQVEIDPGMIAHGDARLLQVALENLLGNAWKFTAKKAEARIEVRQSIGESGAKVFTVRDDGAGFNMRYADKLFGAFQRLHSNKEFPGTGIGLATVQRIVHRHRGRIWAESKIGQGASFCFTLQEESS